MRWRTLASWIARGLLLYLALCAAMFLLQRQLQYHPLPGPMDIAASRVPGLRAETLSTPDGERIVVWWLPPRDDTASVYLYLPGNGANLLARDARLRRLADAGAGFMAVSWRGYGGSSGSPHEAGLRADAGTAYAALAQRAAPQRIVVFGESLGTTVAVLLAAEQPVAALVLDSSFASALEVARQAYWWLPVDWLLRDRYRADLAAPAVRVPVLQIHCRDDPVTPLASAQRLHALLPMRRPLEVVDGRCHTPPMARFDAALRAFVDEVMAR